MSEAQNPRMPLGPPNASDTGAGPLARGASIGRYVVLGLVGKGGMGEVYVAYDPELDRKVAVKLLRVKPGNGVSLLEGRQRTLREAQAIARLNHPNVVVVYDVGTFRDQVFIAMEFVEGHTATYWLQAEARSWEEVLRVFMAAGRGLMAAHDKGLVHRDFKPDNVMVGRDGQVRVMDFGLARQVNEKAAGNEKAGGRPVSQTPSKLASTVSSAAPAVEDEQAADASPSVSTERIFVTVGYAGQAPPPDPMTTVVLNPAAAAGTVSSSTDGGNSSGMFEVQLTRTGAMMGTPAYMAPEQFLGMPTDARTDQFSFCVALYEALYGERPFSGNTMFALTSNVVQGNVREPPASSNVPLWIRKVLLRGLRPSAAERYPSMAHLLDALSKDPTAWRRNWGLAFLAMAVPVTLAFGVRHMADDPREVCSGGPERLTGIWEADLSSASDPSSRRARVKRAFLQTGKGYAADVFSTVDRVLTRYARGWANMYREACEATQVRGEQSAEVLDLRMSCLQERLGDLRALTEVFSEATGEVVEKAVGAANGLGALERCADVPLLRSVVRPPENPATRSRVAELRQQQADLRALFAAGRFREAVQRAPGLLSEARKVGYQPLIAEVAALNGVLLHKSNEAAAAEKSLIEAFWAADASRHDEVRAEAAASLVFVVGYQQRRFDEGRRWAKTAEAILQRMGGHELLQAWVLNDLGNVYELEGHREAAVRAQEEGLAMKVKARGLDHADVGVSEGNLAVALQGLGRNQEALSHNDRAVLLLETRLGSGHPDLATQLSNRGEILNALGRFREARQAFERARIIWERELGIEDRNLGYALTGIGISYLGEGNAASAVVPLERAFKIRETHEQDPSSVAETRFALARALWESGRDRARARILAEDARTGYAKAAAGGKLAEVESWLRERS